MYQGIISTKSFTIKVLDETIVNPSLLYTNSETQCVEKLRWNESGDEWYREIIFWVVLPLGIYMYMYM